ncbi:S-layer homology domain-containing protein [Flavonifractor sp. An306]|uniref:S-layer homology domain-containing protein n=1 Tax=Flavonifractor sp. An306 TaxID=1965629 RepID=UPI00174CFE19|nr:S-layer homology domain-containing protein [Flavonifractor sp. An306]
MKWKRFLPFLLSLCLLFVFSAEVAAAAVSSEQETAASYLKKQGIMVGDQAGNMNLDKGLTRIELATILTRLNGNPEHVQAEQVFYSDQCKFLDVPDWARLYVGYCYFNGLMVGYDTGAFGAYDGVTPAAASTVVLRYMALPEVEWDYSTACQTALEQGLITSEAARKAEITRGDLAIMLYRALGNTGPTDTEEPETPSTTGISKNPDGSINPPADGSQYVPQVGHVIRCDDGTNYTITDVSRWNKNMFQDGPLPDLPAATCDWSLMPQVELPAPEVRRYSSAGQDYLFIRNIYETSRMLYTLYNAIGDNPETWKDGQPVLHPSGNAKVKIFLTIPTEITPQTFWPWRSTEITNLFNSCPPGTYYLEAWDVYKNGVFQRTEYNIMHRI